MMALGAQALSLPDDLEIGSKLTDGCVWAYGQMKTGLMPENCGLVKCDDPEHCTWDEDKWLAKVRQETGWRPKGASRGTPLSESRDESTRTGSKPKYGKPKTSEYEYKVAVGKRHTVEELESSEKRELGPEEETGAKEYPPNIPPGFTNVRDPVLVPSNQRL